MTNHGKASATAPRRAAVLPAATSASGRELQQRAVRTRESVLRAAAEVFYRDGYVAATISEIAACANVTKGALYFHYPSKASLALAVLREHHAAWAKVMTESQNWRLDALDKIDALINSVAASYVDSIVARAGVRLGNEHRFIDETLPVPFVGWIAAMTALLEVGKQDGSVAPHVDAGAAARVIVASFYGVQEVSERLTERKDLMERVDEWWQLFRPTLSADSCSQARSNTAH